MTPASLDRSRPVLVTGATGNVGSEVVRLLRARGVATRAAVRAPEEGSDALDAGVERIALDFERRATFDAAVRGARALFLLRPPAIARVKGTLNALVDRAAAAGVAHVVFVSVAGAERNALVPHHAVEQHLRDGGVGWTILRPGFFAQNFGGTYRDDIRERDEVYVPAGAGRVTFVDVRDLAAVAVDALCDPARHHNRAYTLTGGEAVSFVDAAARLTAAVGRTIRYTPASVAGYASRLRGRGMAWGQIAVQTVLHVGLRFGQAERVDPTLRELLGRAPTSLEAYFHDHAALWR